MSFTIVRTLYNNFVSFYVLVLSSFLNCRQRNVRSVTHRITRIPVGDNTEFRLLGYKNPVRTPQETYVSATEPKRLMLCKI
jgi:hypothetical protein